MTYSENEQRVMDELTATHMDATHQANARWRIKLQSAEERIATLESRSREAVSAVRVFMAPEPTEVDRWNAMQAIAQLAEALK